MDRIKPLDGLRGIAVLIVFLSHTAGRGQYLNEYLLFNGIGKIGVYLFFTLSAFLLGLGLFKKELNKQTIFEFTIKRFLRIVPLYYFIVTSVFVYQFLTSEYSPKYLHVSQGLDGYLQHLYFYRGDGIFWSIVTEMQFYLVAPLIAYIMIRYKKRGVAFLSFIAMANFTLYLLKYPFGIEFLDYISPNTLLNGTYLDVFIPGMIAVYLLNYHSNTLNKYLNVIHKSSNAIFITSLSLSVLLISKNFLGSERLLYPVIHLTFLYAISFSYFSLSVYLGNPISKILSFSPLCYIGKIGFSFYLIHFAVLQYINTFNLPTYAKFSISFALVMLLSSTTYFLIEKPTINLAYKIISRYRT